MVAAGIRKVDTAKYFRIASDFLPQFDSNQPYPEIPDESDVNLDVFQSYCFLFDSDKGAWHDLVVVIKLFFARCYVQL